MMNEPDPIRVAGLCANDLPALAAVHGAAFPESALTKLGPGAVERYYRWLLTGPHDSAALGLWKEGRLAGFCFSGIFRRALSGFVGNHRWYLVGRVLTHPWLIASPIFRDRLKAGLQGLSRPWKPRRRSALASKAKDGPRPCCILSIAIDPAAQRDGLGRRLMQASEVMARQRGFATMELFVHSDNVKAISFYEALGWERELENGIWKGVMRKYLS
jgi:ribosomal protein S18 acetylase RimI-like enzyme